MPENEMTEYCVAKLVKPCDVYGKDACAYEVCYHSKLLNLSTQETAMSMMIGGSQAISDACGFRLSENFFDAKRKAAAKKEVQVALLYFGDLLEKKIDSGIASKIFCKSQASNLQMLGFHSPLL